MQRLIRTRPLTIGLALALGLAPILAAGFHQGRGACRDHASEAAAAVPAGPGWRAPAGEPEAPAGPCVSCQYLAGAIALQAAPVMPIHAERALPLEARSRPVVCTPRIVHFLTRAPPA